MTNVSRLFDFAHYQLAHAPLEKAFNTKFNGQWISTSTAEFIRQADSVSKALLDLGVKPNDKIALISMSNRTE